LDTDTERGGEKERWLSNVLTNSCSIFCQCQREETRQDRFRRQTERRDEIDRQRRDETRQTLDRDRERERQERERELETKRGREIRDRRLNSFFDKF